MLLFFKHILAGFSSWSGIVHVLLFFLLPLLIVFMGWLAR
jgi:hypothetical protein